MSTTCARSPRPAPRSAAGSSTRRFRADLEAAIREAFEKLSAADPQASFAVRSSATAEDLPDASFAGQQETFLNVVGIDDVLAKMKEVFASLYNDRAISYRVHKGFTHADVALSAGVQRMVRSDLGAAGVMFTIDTESGFSDVVFITSSYGLGETVVQGAVNPDEFYVHKPALRAGKQAIIRRNLGSKMIRMEFASAQEKAAVRSPGAYRRCRARAAQPFFAQRCRCDRARPLCADDRGPLWPADGHRVGQGWQATARSTSCRRAPRR